MTKQNILESRYNNINKFSTGFFIILMALVIVLSAVPVKANVSNPELSESCGIDIILVLDSSDSLDNEEIQDVKDAANSFVNVLLPGTPTNIGVIDFDTYVVSTLAPTGNITNIQNAVDSIGHNDSIEYTNWEAAISEADSMLEIGDLMVIITDGYPTTSSSGGDPLNDAVAVANDTKTNGTRIVAIGIDTNGSGGGLDVDNLIAISGPNVSAVPPDNITVDTDVIIGDISGLTDILLNLTTAICGGTITIQKFVDSIPAKGWEFTVDVTGGTADPSFGFTDDNGYIVFDISIDTGNTTAYVNITEIQQGGYLFVNAVAQNCSGQICTDDGVDSLLGIPITRLGCPVTCVFNNTDCNDPPSFGVPSPANASSDQNLLLTWSIDIEDPDGDDFNWTIECINGQLNSTNDDSNGTKELSISCLDYDTTYTVWVNATDGYETTEKWFTFTTREENVPVVPDDFTASANGRFQIDLSWSDDDKADSTRVEWHTVEDGSWSIGDHNLLYNGSSQSINQSGLSPGTTRYYKAWSWNLTDNVWSNGSTANATTNYNNNPSFGAPSPSNGSTDQDLSLTWNVSITDGDNDTFNWTIECSNGQSNNSNGDSNGTKHLSLIGLNYNSEYIIWVNASDIYDTTREWFTFRTREENVPVVPDDFTASANGRFQIDLSWTKGNYADYTYIEWNSTAEPWSRGHGTFLYNNSGNRTSQNGIPPSTTRYYQAWSYNITDNTYSSSYAEANDTTANNQAPMQSNEIPPHNEINIDKMQSFISVNINDPEGDLMNWTIEVSTGNSNSTSNPVGNGTISCNLTTPLSYNANVVWYVNATDGLDWTNETYSFTVESDSSGSNGGNGGGNGESKPKSKPNKEPVAIAGGPYHGFVDEIIEFNGSKSYDIDQYIVLYSWVFGDGSAGEGEIITHFYSYPGIYKIVLMVKDPNGASSTNETVAIIVQPNRPPSDPNISGPTEGLINTEYTFSIVSTDEDNDSIKYIINWGDGTLDVSDSLPSGEFFNLTHKWTESGKFTIKVTVEDNETISTDEFEIKIDEPDTPEEYNIWLIILLIIALLVLLLILYLLETRKRKEKEQ